MDFRKRATTLLLFIVTVFAALPSMALEVGQAFSLGDVRTLDGKTLSSDYFNNKYVIVQVWASWCPYCHKQNANMQKLYEQTRDTDLRILTLSVDQNPANAEKYVKVNGVGFPVAMMTPELAAAIGKRRGIPELYVISPQGRVVQKDFGLMVDADFEELSRYARR